MLPWDYLMRWLRRKPRCPACGMRHDGSPSHHNDEFDRINSAIVGLELRLLLTTDEGEPTIQTRLALLSLGDLREELSFHRQFADPDHVRQNELGP